MIPGFIYRWLGDRRSLGTCVMGEIPKPMHKWVGGESEISGIPSLNAAINSLAMQNYFLSFR